MNENRMNKDAILKKLKESKLDPQKIIILSGASLVVQKIIEYTGDIDLSCCEEYYDSLEWDTKIGAYGIEIKYQDIFEIGEHLYFPNDVVLIDGYRFLNIDRCLEIKKELGREKDIETIQKIETYLKQKTENIEKNLQKIKKR